MQITKVRFHMVALGAMFLMLVCLAIAPANAATELQVYNSAPQKVDVWWNSATPKATNITVTTVPGNQHLQVRVPSNFSGDKGVFTLNPGQRVKITRNSGGDVLNGTITFDCIPVCPCGGANQDPCPVVDGFPLPSKLVNGVNQCEFALNTGFESVDISCVNGAMAATAMNLRGGNPVWKNNVTKAPVSDIFNQRIEVARKLDGNCNNVGVFPFNATDCIQTPKPPCGQPFCFHATRDCQLDRQGSGGVVTVIVNGIYAN